MILDVPPIPVPTLAPGPQPPAAAAPAAPAPAGQPTDGQQLGPDESSLQVAYFAFKIGGPDGKAVGLFRIADDPEAEVLTVERFDPTGEWVEDPSLIDSLQEPGAHSVPEAEAQVIQQEILGAHDPSQDAPPPAA